MLRHGYHVLNDNDLDIEIKNELSLSKFTIISGEGLSVPSLKGYSPLCINIIVGSKYDGWYIVKEFHGLPHPLLLVPPSDIVLPKEN